MAHFACREARIVTQGALAVAGVPIDKVPGAGLREKRNCLVAAPQSEVGKLVKDNGWCCHSVIGCLMLIPSGCLVVTAAKEPKYGIRWSVASDESDTARVKNTLSEMVKEFEEIRCDGHHQSFLGYLCAE